MLIKRAQISKFMKPTWGPPGSCRPQMGPMLAPRTLLSGGPCWLPCIQWRVYELSVEQHLASPVAMVPRGSSDWRHSCRSPAEITRLLQKTSCVVYTLLFGVECQTSINTMIMITGRLCLWYLASLTRCPPVKCDHNFEFQTHLIDVVIISC